MLHRPSRLVPAAALLTAFLAGAVPAAGQLKLPGKPAEKVRPEDKGDLAPHVECKVCKTRSYTAPSSSRVDENGDLVTWCATCKRDTPHRSGAGSVADGIDKRVRSKDSDLKLPRARRTAPAKPAGSAQPPGSEQAAPAAGVAAKPGAAAPASTAPVDPSAVPANQAPPAATRIFAELRRARSLDDPLLAHALTSLVAAGDAGLAAARAELTGSDPAPFVVAARVLLAGGTAEDCARVADRLRQKVPTAATAVVLDELVARDPVRATPRYLVDLLEHAQPGVRHAATRHLKRLPGSDVLPLLPPALASKRSETRLLAVDLMGHIDDPRVTELLLARIDDASPRVAAEAIAGLLLRHDPGLDQRLVALALGDRWVLRRQACALLAIVEREDAHLSAILDTSHAEPLLVALESSDPFVSGAAATALAGIGYRSANATATAWLDREIIDHLVAAVSGQRYFDEFSLLAGPATRRLRQLTGESADTDGPRWVAWWVGARESFHARRASLAIGPDEAGELVVRIDVGGGPEEAFVLVGPAAAATWSQDGVPAVFLTARETLDLGRAFAADDLLGTACLPGVRGVRGRGDRTLEIAVRSRSKAFTFGTDVSEPWFERAYSAARAVRERNRWQAYPDLTAAKSAREFWQQESAWWSGEHTDAERNLRLKRGILTALPHAAPALRDQGTAELARLYADPAVREPGDFAAILQLVSVETIVGARARALCDLALAAACHVRAEVDGKPATLASVALGRELAEVLLTRFGDRAGPLLERIAAGSERELARALATDTRAPVRAAMCSVLASGASEPDVQVLVRLLDDPEPGVQIAAASALGAERIEAARTELLVRARLAHPEVRAAALEAIGRLGGDFVLDALVLGSSDENPIVRRGAASGLAELGDPSAAQILVSMLTESPDGETYAAARAGLQKFGNRAYPDLLRVMNSPVHRGRREAALYLAEEGVAEAASALMQILSTAHNDTRVANELAVLTCTDQRSQPDPAAAWWAWYDGVRHDDARSWFYAALERAGLPPPPAGGLEPPGTPEGREYLLALLQRPESWLCERARREYARLVGRDPGPLPPSTEDRDAWIRTLRESASELRKP